MRRTDRETENSDDDEGKNPRLAGFLRGTTQAIVQLTLFFLFVGLDMGKSIQNKVVMSSSDLKRRNVHIVGQSLLIVQSLIQIVLGIVTAAIVEGPKGLARLCVGTRFLKFSIVSMLFAAAQSFAILGYSVLPAGTIKIIGQWRLFQLAVLSQIVLRRLYNQTQWLVLVIIVTGCALHIFALQDMTCIQEYRTQSIECDLALLNQTGHILDGRPAACAHTLGTALNPCNPAFKGGSLEGVLFVFTYLFLSDLASIISEKFLKSEKETPFYIQKVTMEIMGLPMSLAMSFAVPSVETDPKRQVLDTWWVQNCSHWGNATGLPEHCGMEAGGLFRNWNEEAVYGALFFSTAQSWFSGLIVKQLSSVMKGLAKNVSVGAVFFIGDCLVLRDKDDPLPSSAAIISTCLVMTGSYTFVGIPMPDSEKVDPLASAASLQSGTTQNQVIEVEMSMRSQNAASPFLDESDDQSHSENLRSETGDQSHCQVAVQQETSASAASGTVIGLVGLSDD